MSRRSTRPVRSPTILVGAFLSLCALGTWAGSLDAPAAPNNAGSAMYTLQALHDRLVTGATGAKRTGSFDGPVSEPNTGTMVTLDGIMARMPAINAIDGAAPGDVLSGKTYWGLTATGWGPRTGTYEPLCTCNSPSYIYNATNGGTRWCINANANGEDGTVTDLLGATVDGKSKGRCLVWLRKADWGGMKSWRTNTIAVSDTDFPPYDDARTRAGSLKSGTQDAGLTDGSIEGSWRLPALSELKALVSGTEAFSYASLGPFLALENTWWLFWSYTTDSGNTNFAWYMVVFTDRVEFRTGSKANFAQIWPVRGGRQ